MKVIYIYDAEIVALRQILEFLNEQEGKSHKGYFSDNDKLKMEKVKEYNKEKNILILLKKELENLNIDLYAGIAELA